MEGPAFRRSGALLVKVSGFWSLNLRGILNVDFDAASDSNC